MPIEDLIELCHSRGVPVFIDGAHGLGSLPLDLGALGADYYVGNCHKWFCCTPGCAFLYVRRTHRDGPALRLDVVEKIAKEDGKGHEESKTNDASHVIHPLVISHGFGEGFTSNFIWSGYHDYSSVLTFPAVLALWKRIGLERVWNYNVGLLHQAVDLLQSRWDASVRKTLLVLVDLLLCEHSQTTITRSPVDRADGNAPNNGPRQRSWWRGSVGHADGGLFYRCQDPAGHPALSLHVPLPLPSSTQPHPHSRPTC